MGEVGPEQLGRDIFRKGTQPHRFGRPDERVVRENRVERPGRAGHHMRAAAVLHRLPKEADKAGPVAEVRFVKLCGGVEVVEHHGHRLSAFFGGNDRDRYGRDDLPVKVVSIHMGLKVFDAVDKPV